MLAKVQNVPVGTFVSDDGREDRFVPGMMVHVGEVAEFGKCRKDSDAWWTGIRNWTFHRSWLEPIDLSKMGSDHLIARVKPVQVDTLVTDEGDWFPFISDMNEYCGRVFVFTRLNKHTTNWFQGPGGWIFHRSWLETKWQA